MKFTIFAAAVLAASLVAAGCDKDDSKMSTPAGSGTSTGAMGDKANAAADKVKSDAAVTQDKMAAAGADMKADADKAAAEMKSNAAGATDGVVAQAQKLYADATTALTDKKFDDAQKYVDQLKALRDKLPADWQTKVDDLVKKVADMKSMMGAVPNMGSVPGMGK